MREASRSVRGGGDDNRRPNTFAALSGLAYRSFRRCAHSIRHHHRESFRNRKLFGYDSRLPLNNRRFKPFKSVQVGKYSAVPFLKMCDRCVAGACRGRCFRRAPRLRLNQAREARASAGADPGRAGSVSRAEREAEWVRDSPVLRVVFQEEPAAAPERREGWKEEGAYRGHQAAPLLARRSEVGRLLPAQGSCLPR